MCAIWLNELTYICKHNATSESTEIYIRYTDTYQCGVSIMSKICEPEDRFSEELIYHTIS